LEKESGHRNDYKEEVFFPSAENEGNGKIFKGRDVLFIKKKPELTGGPNVYRSPSVVRGDACHKR